MEELKCNNCGKSFKTKESLNQHIASKHSVHKKTTSNKGVGKKLIAYGILLLILVGIGSLIYSSVVGSHKYDDFAKCLTDKDAKFYGAFWCPRCADQKKLFSKSIEFVTYVECSTPDRSAQLQVCVDAGITSYPTWIFEDESRLSGVIPLKQLAEKTGCNLE